MNHTSFSTERGVTLIEATIVLSVFAVLTAMAAPTINGYINTARQTRAREDVQTIATALQDFIADNAENQILSDGNGGGLGVYSQNPPDRSDPRRVNLLVSDGDVPSLNAGILGDSFWRLPVNAGAVDTFSNHLAENVPNEAAAGVNRYRNATDATIAANGGQLDFARFSSSGFNAPYAWRGPYLRSPVDPDPWGNRYAANVVFLDPAATAVIGGILGGFPFADYPRLDVFVMSAGPDEEIDTRAAQDGAVPGDDDFIYIVSANAR